MARTPVNSFGQNRDLLSSFEKVTSTFKEWRPASDVIEEVNAIPTVFPQYDIATRVMGHPTARFCRVRGPSNEGKTTFNMGLIYSFLRAGHFAGFVDAERTTPPKYIRELMGEYFKHPGFSALPVNTYEQVVDSVREYCEKIAEARDKGIIPPETSGIICIDSIRKLVPKNLMKELAKSGTSKKGIDGFGGRGGQIKAALNAAWCDELVPLLANTKMAMCIIARETDDPDAGLWDEGIKVGGGKALLYDSSLDIRVVRSFITDEENKKKIFGERHRIEIRKTKIGQKEEKFPVGHFHTSNGTECEENKAGFDRVRDVFELALEYGVIKLAGSSYSYGGEVIGRGQAKALLHLRREPDFTQQIEVESRNAACADW
jgi:recombination protein RecA